MAGVDSFSDWVCKAVQLVISLNCPCYLFCCICTLFTSHMCIQSPFKPFIYLFNVAKINVSEWAEVDCLFDGEL